MSECKKFEALFTFSDEKTLLEHIAKCENCKKEYEKMQKVSALINEVKPKFKKKKLTSIKAACLVFIIMIGSLSIYVADEQYGVLDTIKYGEQLTMEDLGIPTDNYGIIKAD